MDEDKTNANYWQPLWSLLDVSSLNDTFKTADIVEDCLENCRQYLPDIPDIDVTLTGSRQEGSWLAKFFRTDSSLAIIESDLLVTLKDQTLEHYEKDNLLEPIHGRPGFVNLKRPFWLWFDSMKDMEMEDMERRYIVIKDDAEYVSSVECRNWVQCVQNANNPWTQPSPDRLKVLMLLEDDSDVTLNGPAATACFNQSGSALIHTAMHFFIRHFDFVDANLLNCLVESYELCLETMKTIRNFMSEMSAGCVFPEIDLNTGVLKCADERKNSQCDDPSHLISINQRVFQAIEKLLENCKKLEELYEKDCCGIPSVAKLVPPILIDPDCIVEYEQQLRFLITMKSMISEMKWYLEQDIHCESATVEMLNNMKTNLQGNDLLMKNTYEADYVFSVKCDFWPDEAKEWISRERKQPEFPSANLCQDIIESGVHIVPKSYPGGDQALNWRYSFSIAEAKLVESRTKAQNYAYFILKCIYYEQLHCKVDDEKGKHCKLGDEKSKICSYHIKTIMMWACENYDADLWNEDNIVPCITHLLNDTAEAFDKKQLPHYFISGCNLLQDTDKLIADLVHDKAREMLKSITDYPSKDSIERIVRDVNKIKTIFGSIPKMKQLIKLRIDASDAFFDCVESICGEDWTMKWNLEPVMDIDEKSMNDLANVITENQIPHTKTIQDMLISQKNPYQIKLDWMKNIEQTLIKHVNQPEDFLELLELDYDTSHILHKTATKTYLENFVGYLLDGPTHPAVFAIYRHLNFTDFILQRLQLDGPGGNAAVDIDYGENVFARESMSENLLDLDFSKDKTEKGSFDGRNDRFQQIKYKIANAVQQWNEKIETFSNAIEERVITYSRISDSNDEIDSEQIESITPLLITIPDEKFHTYMIMELLKGIKKFITEDEEVSPEVIALLALLQQVQCNYENKLLMDFKKEIENVNFTIEGGLD